MDKKGLMNLISRYFRESNIGKKIGIGFSDETIELNVFIPPLLYKPDSELRIDYRINSNLFESSFERYFYEEQFKNMVKNKQSTDSQLDYFINYLEGINKLNIPQIIQRTNQVILDNLPKIDEFLQSLEKLTNSS